MAQQRDRIAGFDGLRAIAFLLVFASHKLSIDHAGVYGDIGVWMFFALSGFLITRILVNARADIEAGGSTFVASLRKFYIKRTARIFPIYYLVLLFFVVLSWFTSVDNFWFNARASYFLFLTNLFIGLRNAWVGDFGHLWTLAVEEQFYLLFAPLVLWLPRSRTQALCLAFIAVGVLTKVVMELLGAPPTSTDVNSLTNFALLGFGGLVGLNVDRKAPAWVSSGPAQVAAGVCFVGLAVVFGAYETQWMRYAKITVLLAGLILFQVYNRPQTGFVRFLDSAPLRRVGRVSYGAYLFHHFIHMSDLRGALLAHGLDPLVPPWLDPLGELAITLALAAVSWAVLERPAIAWASRVAGTERATGRLRAS
ncbi:acyltransferase family protein [Phenylobacterium sp.]|uniref:acyltransferase family protein n=1 Tax=Phenylobacterium sp. TaxID=1871053 RepID=UPI0035B167B5